jgi:hypothetical protein
MIVSYFPALNNYSSFASTAIYNERALIGKLTAFTEDVRIKEGSMNHITEGGVVDASLRA